MCELKIKKVERVSGHWFTVKINDKLNVDLSTSNRDKRDWIISKRESFKLEQDKGFISCWSKKGWTLAELKAELLDVAKQLYSEQFSEQTLKCASTLKNI